jgi:hypothetical protein
VRSGWSTRELATVLASWWLLPALAAWLRLRGMRAVRASLRQRTGRPRGGLTAPALARAVDAAASFQPAGGSCLPRSVLLEWLLRRAGIPCTLRIGARRTGSQLEAHAWVECDGRPLNDTADVASRFPAFPELPAGGRHSAP